jgi:hypothetical protein
VQPMQLVSPASSDLPLPPHPSTPLHSTPPPLLPPVLQTMVNAAAPSLSQEDTGLALGDGGADPDRNREGEWC